MDLRPLAGRAPLLLPTTLLTLTLSVPSSAQDVGIRSPGMSGSGGLGQTTRFDNEFNPAISFSLDALFDHTETDGSDEDGLSMDLRRMDLLGAAWIDPRAWAWTTIAYEGELVLDEAAVNYIGLPGHHILRIGRFFVDFGKQMQSHLEELRTIDRPLVLSTYLGEELPADGIQWDNWFALGEETLMRYSVGAFMGLAGHQHDHDHGHGHEAELHLDDRLDYDEVNLAARLTGMTDVGTNGTLQAGFSFLNIPEYAFEFEDDATGVTHEEEGLDRMVVGLDLTYGWNSDSGIESWLFGGELLLIDGDLSGEFDDGGTPGVPGDDSLEVLDDDANGFYLFADHKWDQKNSAGAQYTHLETLEECLPTADVYDLYWTHELSEFLRLRIGLTHTDFEDDDDWTRLGVQLTSFVGPHGHGINW